jgi:hypothetical protein
LFTGSISENRVTVGLPPPVREELADEARRNGLKVPEIIRHILIDWFKIRNGLK